MARQQARLEKGKAVFDEVYGGVVELSAEQKASDFSNIMLQNVFAEVWGRKTMSIKDRRLILIGIIAAVADPSIMEIQLRAALAKGELTREQLPEIPIFLTQYIGYPRTVKVNEAVRRVLAATAPKGKQKK
jgi:4-carboxymuconolactone decarboxylase